MANNPCGKLVAASARLRHDSDMPKRDRAADIVTLLAQQGGTGTRVDLTHAVSRAALESALRQGWVTHLGNGSITLPRLAIPPLGDAGACRSWTSPDDELSSAANDHITSLLAFARGHQGVLSHRSAAVVHGWAVLNPPDSVELIFPRGRRRPRDSAVPITARNATVTAEELRLRCTSPLNTVIACARDLDPAEALAIADSALRCGDIGTRELRSACDRYTGRRANRVRRVLSAADRGAANPFESALRWILQDVRGVEFSTQVRVEDSSIDLKVFVDLGVEELRLACEADSYEFHGGRENFQKDRRRYALLNAAGWIVLTFTLRQVREEPEWVRQIVEIMVDVRRAHLAAEKDAASWRRLQRKHVRAQRRSREHRQRSRSAA